MIKREVKKLPNSQVEIKISVPWDDWKKYIKNATEEVSKDLKIEGFRPGKAPKDMVEKRVGKPAILEKAAEKAIQKTYARVIEEEKIEAIGYPQADILKLAENNELEYKIITAIVPEVSMEDWKDGVKKVNKKFSDSIPDVKDEEVEKEIENLASSRAKLVTVKREAKDGDSVLVDFEVSQNGVPIENGSGKNHPLVIGKGTFIPGFEENLVGMKEGDEKKFELEFPKEYHEKSLAGKPAEFKVKVNSVQERDIPKIDDEFAKSLGKFENAEELRKRMKEGMVEERKAREKEKQHNEIIDALIGKSEVEIPEILIRQEMEKMIQEFSTQVQSMGMDLDTYLGQLKKTKEDLEKEWKPQAEKRIKASLVLEKVAKDMEIKVPAEEIEEEINKTLQYYKSMNQAEKNIDTARLYNYTKGMLVNKKAFEYLVKLS